MRVLSMDTKKEVIAVGFTPGRPRLVAVNELSRVRVWDLASREEPLSFTAGMSLGKYLKFSPEGRFLLALHGGSRLGLDLRTLYLTESRLTIEGELRSFDQTPNGKWLVTCHNNPSQFVGWHHRNGQWVEDWTVERGEDDLDECFIALAPTGDRFAHWCRVRGSERLAFRLAIRSARTGVEQERGECPLPDPTPLLFRPDGAQLVTVHESTILVWPVPEPGKPRTIYNDSRRYFTAAAFHPSSRYLFTTSNDATVVVWDVTSWKPITRFTWDIGRLRSMAVSPDGTLAAAGSDKGRVVVWDVDL